MSKLLIDELPLIVLPSLVKLVGIEKALILQQVHYACQQPRSGKILSDRKKYVWNTYDEWQTNYFPFWSTKTIQRHFLILEKEGYLISCQPQLNKGDATKYYRVDEDFLSDRTHSLTCETIPSHKLDYPISQVRPSLNDSSKISTKNKKPLIFNNEEKDKKLEDRMIYAEYADLIIEKVFRQQNPISELRNEYSDFALIADSKLLAEICVDKMNQIVILDKEQKKKIEKVCFNFTNF